MGIRRFEWLSYQVAMALKQDIEPVGGDEPPPRFSVRGWEAVRERLVGSTFPGGSRGPKKCGQSGSGISNSFKMSDGVRMAVASSTIAAACSHDKVGLTEPSSRIAMTSCGIEDLLAAIC
jgi:hypothetical protein